MSLIDRTPKEALDYLLGFSRLTFGHDLQIDAMSILGIAEQLIELPRECPECDGEGSVECGHPGECTCCGRKCVYCGADYMRCDTCKGNGSIDWTRDEVYELKPQMIVKLLEAAEIHVAA